MLNKTQSVMGNNNRCKICNGRLSGKLEHQDDFFCLGHRIIIDGRAATNEHYFNLMVTPKYCCHECGDEYKIDLIIPDDLWVEICPKIHQGGKTGGLLCGKCIMEKLELITKEADCFYLNSFPKD